MNFRTTIFPTFHFNGKFSFCLCHNFYNYKSENYLMLDNDKRYIKKGEE